jgi:hypothetical protein
VISERAQFGTAVLDRENSLVPESCAIVRLEAKFGGPSKGEGFEKMAPKVSGHKAGTARALVDSVVMGGPRCWHRVRKKT